MGVSLYGAWMVAPVMEMTITPDLAKRRRLDVRLGGSWYPTIAGGTAGWSDLLRWRRRRRCASQHPGSILALAAQPGRGPVAARRADVVRLEAALAPPAGAGVRAFLRRRQTSLTPFVNVEVIWTTTQDMWDQFRMQAGLQLGVQWFGKGQVIEVNGSLVTYLQPSRSYSPVIGVVWYQYF